MVSLKGAAQLRKLNVELAECLESLGWNIQRLGTLQDAESLVVDSVLAGARAAKEGSVFRWEDLTDLIYECNLMAEVAWKAEGSASDAELLEASMVARKEAEKVERQRGDASRIMKIIPRKGKAKVTRWPTRLGKLMSVVGKNEQLRHQVEEAERDRWIKELKSIMEEAGLPAVTAGGWEGFPTVRIGKGRRASTLRKHVKTWTRARSWLISAFGVPWPQHAVQFALYLESRAMEPCGKSIPASIYKTLMFMEHAGEVHKDDRIQNDPALKNALEEISVRLESGEIVPRKQAMHIPVKIAMAWEQVVGDESQLRYIRAYAWFKLLKIWGAMRFSDTTGVRVETAGLEGDCWAADLDRTKTTGPGKRVNLVKVFVSKHAYLKNPDWLTIGWKLWEQMGFEASLERRDFLLPLPSPDLESFVRRMANYASTAIMSQALAGKLLYEDGGKAEMLLEPGIFSVWTEHSERATLRTWARAAGIDEETCKRLGRWTPTVDQAYDRSVRRRILLAQTRVAVFIRRNLGHQDPFDEELALKRMGDLMEAMGFNKDETDAQMVRLRSFYEFGPPSKKQKWVELCDLGAVEEHAPEPECPEELAAERDEVESVSSEAPDPVEAKPVVARGMFVICTVGRSGRKTLHRVGECHRLPGVHFQDFEVVGDEPPEASSYHHACLQCFPRGAALEESDEEASSSGDASSSDTLSGEREGD